MFEEGYPLPALIYVQKHGEGQPRRWTFWVLNVEFTPLTVGVLQC